MSIWTILFVILLIAWLGGFTVFHVAGGLIHLLLVLAVISLILHFVLGARTLDDNIGLRLLVPSVGTQVLMDATTPSVSSSLSVSFFQVIRVPLAKLRHESEKIGSLKAFVAETWEH